MKSGQHNNEHPAYFNLELIMKKKWSLIPGLCLLFLAMAACVCADEYITNPSFEETPFGFETDPYGWTAYSYNDGTLGIPAFPQVGGIFGSGSTFDLLISPYIHYVPNGKNVCGLQSTGDGKNGGVYQSFYWYGGPATIEITARAYSAMLPDM